MDDSALASFVIPLEARLIDAAHAIRESRHRCVIAVSGGKAVGVLSEGDILRALLNGSDVHGPVEAWVSHGFKFLRTNDRQAALALMRQHGITLVPVLDDDFRLYAVITLLDVLADCELRSGAADT